MSAFALPGENKAEVGGQYRISMDQDFLMSSFSHPITDGTNVLLTSKTTARDSHWAYAVDLDALNLGPGEELLVDLFQRVVHVDRQPVQS